jgi:hypothetical protein
VQLMQPRDLQVVLSVRLLQLRYLQVVLFAVLGRAIVRFFSWR